MTTPPSQPGSRLTDLRSSLKYVQQFKNRLFIIAIDSSIISDENLPNLVLDIAILQGLNINLVLSYGILDQKAEESATPGTGSKGAIDAATLERTVSGADQANRKLIRELSLNNLPCAVSNAVRATEVGILKGRDQGFAGKVDKIDTQALQHLSRIGTIPIIAPIALDRGGRHLHINPDCLSSELAVALQAAKLIFLTPTHGLSVNGKFFAALTFEETQALLSESAAAMDANTRSKISASLHALKRGVPRVHLIDGRVNAGLLNEIFSRIGIGTMIHANEYQQIRNARKKDAQTIFNITKNVVKTEALRYRSRQSIEKSIRRFFVYEIDENIIACVCLEPHPEANALELSTLFVQPFYQGKGAGRKLVEFACAQAKATGMQRLFALTTQSYPFFKSACGFEDAPAEKLPETIKARLAKSGRNSKVLLKRIED